MIKRQSKPLKGSRPGIQGTFRTTNRPGAYPSADPTTLIASASESSMLITQLNLLLIQLRDNQEFATRLMDAAQRSHQSEVDRLIKSTGVVKPYALNYNPQGFHMKLQHDDSELSCCTVEVTLLWGD